MSLIDFILNLAGLLLWLNWRAAQVDPLGKRKPATLIGTLRRTESEKTVEWQVPAILGGLLLLRAIFYWQIGSAFNPVWTGRLDFGVIELSFRSDFFTRMLLFSIFSFGLTLAIFYVWLLLLSILAGPEPVHSLVRMQLGPVDRWSRSVKWFLPLTVGALLWWLASWPLSWMDVGSYSKAHFLPQQISMARRIASSLLIGANAYLIWKFLIGALLSLHLLNSYVYFGKHPFWDYINYVTQKLLQPLQAGLHLLWRICVFFLPRSTSLRAEKINFTPNVKNALESLIDVLGIALTFFLAQIAQWLLIWLYKL